MNSVAGHPFPGQLFVYAENWIPHEKIASSGLDRALVPIIDALMPWDPIVMLAPRRASQMRHPLHSTVAPFVARPSLLSTIMDEWRAKREADYDGYGHVLAKHVKSARRRSGGILLSVLGGDGRAYVRAAQLARDARLRHIIYSVDDPFAWADERASIRPRLVAIKPAVRDALTSASAVLTITSDLAAALLVKISRQCQSLTLPYVEAPAQAKVLKRQIIYVGTMSHLYGDSFVQVVEAVHRRRSLGDDLELRATFAAESLDGLLTRVPDFVKLGRINDRGAFLEEIAGSLAAVCPISFDPKQEMIRTSFPSKLLDYLGHARAVIVHGPAESVAARYMNEIGLPYVSSSLAELDEVLQIISDKQPDLRFKYRSELDRAHGGEQFRATLRSVISEITSK